MKKSYIHVYTGDGKGKTTAAMGLAIRAAGRGLRVKVVQFLKGRATGEMFVMNDIDNIEFIQVSKCKKFFPDMSEDEKTAMRSEVRDFWPKIQGWLGDADLLILDEALGAISVGLLSVSQVCDILDTRQTTEVVLTGRDSPDEIIDRAHVVTDMHAVKHYMDDGVKARAGIEY
ncbi:MAG: cob(I)yrinic acid a,c-diamide adenosyltransferase [Clostridia bacterium]|jgi:cob(I)alamin adenosyltransferase|nr:cob(I)yrinic acid a,c-diamide adenosyltransferase [Clostridia bacterium]